MTSHVSPAGRFPQLTSKAKLLVAFISFILIACVSCKKGDTGPAGSANVLYSDWFTPSTYVKDTVFGTYGFYYDKAVPGLTKNILDSGTLIVYGKLSGYNPLIWPAGQIGIMPITITYSSGPNANIDVWSALATPGNLRILLTSSQNAYNGISNLHQFRYVIIPGGNHISSSATNLSYKEVCYQLGIPQ